MPDEPQTAEQPLVETEPEPPFADNKLHWACMNGHLESVQHWMSEGAGLSSTIQSTKPIHRCAGGYEDAPEVMDFLLANGALEDMEDMEHGGYRPLHLACLKGHSGIGKALIDAGADLHALNKDGKTPQQLIEFDPPSFSIIVKPRQEVIYAGKQTLREAFAAREAELQADSVVEEQKLVQPCVSTDPEPIDQMSSPSELEVEDVPSTPVVSKAVVMAAASPMDRVAALEMACGYSSPGGMLPRLKELEMRVMGEAQAGAIPARLATLEENMGMTSP